MATAAWCIATTKLTAPARRQDVLLRTRLIAAIRESLAHCRVTLISAPAGSGKTTLLAEIPREFPEVRFCWLLLDSDDNDPSRFMAALSASVKGAGIESDDGPPYNEARRWITFLINRIAERESEAFILVLDDLHVVEDPSIHKTLDYLVDHLPSNLRVILATRHDPAMALGRRRARGELGEIRLGDLNFTEHESSLLANECLQLGLSLEQVGLLHARTEGWAAGLRLLAVSLTQSPHGHLMLLQQDRLQGSGAIFDFLAEEVLDRQPEELRRFLLETSILGSLRPDVCDALTGRIDSKHLLEDLYRRNLYVVAADQTASTFRYHDLFADFLRQKFQRERPSDWRELHLRAAGVAVSSHDRLGHLLTAEAWDEAACEIERLGPDYSNRGFVVTLRRWISALPERVRDEHPRVLYLLGQLIWTQTEFAKAQPYIEKALAAFRNTNDLAGQGEALIALANSALMFNELEKCRDLLREALTYDIPFASRVQLHSASAWDGIYRQDWPEAIKHIDKVFTLLESEDGRANPLAIILVLYSQGIPGYVDKLDRTCRVIQAQLTGVPNLSHASYYALNSSVLLHRGNMQAADRDALRAVEIARECGHLAATLASLCMNFILTAASRGDWADVERWATQGADESRHGQFARNWRVHFLVFQARARWHTRNMEGLRLTYEDAMTLNPHEAPPAAPYRLLIRGMLAMAEHSYAKAEQAFREAVFLEDRFQITRATCSTKIMLAYVLLSRGRPAEALEVFAPFLAQSSQYNTPGQLMSHHPLVQPLLREAHRRNIEPAYVQKVLDAMGAPLNPMEGVGGGEMLSKREMDVLRVMSEGLGNREIGVRLFVSEATVKTHVQRILHKLDAHSRTQAVTRARELLLI